MITVQEIEAAIAKLKPTEFQQVVTWINNHGQNVVPPDRLARIRQARGIWKDRTDLPDLRKLRGEFDRF
jgi:hypothetical protein